jgi:hypothetical protein
LADEQGLLRDHDQAEQPDRTRECRDRQAGGPIHSIHETHSISNGRKLAIGGLFLDFGFLGIDLPVLFGLRPDADMRDVGIDARRRIGRPIAGLLRARDAARGFLFLLLSARPFAGAFHGGWS